MSTASRLRREQSIRATSTQGSRAPRRHAVREQPTLRDRLRYRFDTSMSRGASALIWYLGAAVAAVVLIFAAIVLIAGVGPTHNPVTAIYNAFLHTIDSGTIAGDAGTGYILLQLVVTAGGIVIFSAFIGVLATSIDSRLLELRKGRSPVLERDHTLILGWSESIFTVISELVIANESLPKASIVVLGDRDKVEMEDAIRERIPDLRTTKVVCRTGNPLSVPDLGLVNHHDARSIIVLAPDTADPDAAVIKTLLALTRSPHRREADYHIVAEIAAASNLDAARLAGGHETVLVDQGRSVSRLIVQTSRQSGAAVVYQDLLDFDGDEIYIRADERLYGRTYGEALLAYEDCTVIGLRHADGDVRLNPPTDTAFGPGDSIIAIAEDDSVLEKAVPPTCVADDGAIVATVPAEPESEATLVLGFNERTTGVISELSEYTRPGSFVTLVAADPPAAESIPVVGENLYVDVRAGDVTDRALLDALDLGDYARVIVMADGADPQCADARALVTLLHLRDIADRTGASFTVVSEILDEADRALATVARVDDVVISEQVVSLMLAQISENPGLEPILGELFAADGSEIYMRPADDYVVTGREVSFATMVVAARERGETAIGYRVAAAASDPEENFGISLNPRKARSFVPAEGDRLIVLAED